MVRSLANDASKSNQIFMYFAPRPFASQTCKCDVTVCHVKICTTLGIGAPSWHAREIKHENVLSTYSDI
jgi:hypothetical protein